jgi:hypothetical protein
VMKAGAMPCVSLRRMEVVEGGVSRGLRYSLCRVAPSYPLIGFSRDCY